MSLLGLGLGAEILGTTIGDNVHAVGNSKQPIGRVDARRFCRRTKAPIPNLKTGMATIRSTVLPRAVLSSYIRGTLCLRQIARVDRVLSGQGEHLLLVGRSGVGRREATVSGRTF